MHVPDFLRDLRIAFRALRKRPGFTAVAVITLALGVGASTSMFSAVNAVLLRPLPFDRPADIYSLREVDLRDGADRAGVSLANVRDLAERSRTLSAVAGAEGPHGLRLQEDGRGYSLRTWLVSEGFFEAMGVEAALGRTFLPEEYQEGNERVVLLGHETWVSRYGSDPGIVGRDLSLDGAAHRVVGVLPPEFAYPAEAELWGPRPVRSIDESVIARGGSDARGVVRLASGFDAEAAQAELDRLAAELEGTFPESNENTGFRLVPIRDELFGEARSPLLLLFGAVFLVLLIAATNVAGLQLARGSSRSREFALRAALGAGADNVVRLVLVESLLIGGFGALLGIDLAYLGVEAIRTLAPDYIPRVDAMRVDAWALVFALVVAVGSAVVAGVVPALRASGLEPNRALGDGARGSTTGRGAGGLRDRLVMAEVALALVLTVGAGLLIQSFSRLQNNELGFDPESRLAAQVWAYDDSHRPDLTFFEEAAEELSSLPGVLSVGLTTDLPQADDQSILSRSVTLGYTFDGSSAPSSEADFAAGFAAVDPDFPEALGIRVLGGRTFNDLDGPDAPPVALVNEAFARRHSVEGDPGEGVVGRRVALLAGANGSPARAREIVGVLSNVRRRGYAGEARPEIYAPLPQAPSNGLTFVVHTAGDPALMMEPVREALRAADPLQAIWALRPMTEILDEWTRQRRFNTIVLTAFSLLALMLSAVGIYGLISFSVEERVGEVAIRRALGGESRDILRWVLGKGIALVAVGVGFGLLGSLVFSRLLGGMLYSIRPLDPPTYAVVAAFVMAVGVSAALIPACRALRVEPMAVLRKE